MVFLLFDQFLAIRERERETIELVSDTSFLSSCAEKFRQPLYFLFFLLPFFSFFLFFLERKTLCDAGNSKRKKKEEKSRAQMYFAPSLSFVFSGHALDGEQRAA